MRCNSLTAYLNKEFGPIRSALMRMHIAACPSCRKIVDEETYLSREIRRLEDTPVPQTLRDRLISDAIAAAQASSRQSGPRLQGVLTMKRGLIALVLAIAITVCGFGLLPGLMVDRALAQVAHAIENVRTMHLVIERTDSKTGKHSTEELWIEMPARYRLLCDNEEIIDDGRKMTDMITFNGVTTATISQSKGLEGLDPAGSVFALFNFNEIRRKYADKVKSRTPVTLPNGRKATVWDFGDINFVVDDSTYLPVKAECYWTDGKLCKVIRNIEYNVEIPDSVFSAQIPKGAVVIDTLKSSTFSPEAEINRRELADKLEKAGAWKIAWRVGVKISSVYDQNSGSVGSPAHPGMRFTPLDYGKLWLFYIPEHNSYFALGRWLVTDPKMEGYKVMVQDREFTAPRKPEPLPTYPDQVRVADAKPGQCDNWTRMQNLGPNLLTVIERHSWSRGRYYDIRGRAKHIPDGRIYENETVAREEMDDLTVDVPYPAMLDWGNLPEDRVKSMTFYIYLHNRVARILGSKNRRGYPVYRGAVVQDIGWLDDSVPLSEGNLELYHPTWRDMGDAGLGKRDWTKEISYVLRVPSKHLFICIGNVKVKYPEKPDRIRNKDCIVTFDGDILPFKK